MNPPTSSPVNERDTPNRTLIRFGARAALMLGAVLLLIASGVSGCRRRPHVKGTVAVDDVLQTWNEIGFDTASVENVDAAPWSAGACSRGQVANLDVLMCEFASDETLARGEQQIQSELARDQVSTGLVTRTSRTLLAIADKGDVDPSGQTVMKLVQGFRAVRQP